MEEKDKFAHLAKREKITFIHRINKGRKKIKINSKTVIYGSLIIFLLILFIIIITLYIENKRLYQNIIKGQNKKISISINTMNNGKKITIANKLFQYQNNENENYNYSNMIHVAYSLDNQLIYPTLVSMISGLENFNNNNSVLVYHLLFSHDFNTSKIEIFESLKENYKVIIKYYVIPNIFSYSRISTPGTDCVYYKILLSLLLPHLHRILYLDEDTLIRKDISEIYNSPFNDNYVLGFPLYMSYTMDKYGTNDTHYINDGCILFNIDKIRKDQKDLDLLQFTIKNNTDSKFREQNSINSIFFPKIGNLPLKYGIYMRNNKTTYENDKEGYEAVDDPVLVHFSCCQPKVWINGTKNQFKNDEICIRYQKEFYYYANKTQYYSEIYNSLFYPK